MWVQDPDLAWAAHDGGKPGRSGSATYVLHSTPEFARRYWHADPGAWGEPLLAAFAKALGVSLPAVVAHVAHRWRYAQPASDQPHRGAMVDRDRGLIAIGDGIAGGRVEGAWLSGLAVL
jgi:predicted NAD/FAD-dependent oxidoreductase